MTTLSAREALNNMAISNLKLEEQKLKNEKLKLEIELLKKALEEKNNGKRDH